MKLTRCRFEWKVADLWIGAYFRTTMATTDAGRVPFATDVWICLLPCVPLHLTFFHDIDVGFCKASEASIDGTC